MPTPSPLSQMKVAPAKTSKVAQRNIGFRVTGYDNESPDGPFVLGVVITPTKQEGETVKVRMYTEAEAKAGFPALGVKAYRPNQYQYTGKDKVEKTGGYTDAENAKHFKNRPTVKKWQKGFKVGANAVNPVPVGGLMLASSAIKVGDVYVTQYLDQYGRDDNYDMRYGAAIVRIFPEVAASPGVAAKRLAANVTVLAQQDAVLLKSANDIKNFFDEHFTDNKNGVEHRPMGLVRFISTVNNEITAGWISPAKTQKVVPSVKDHTERTVSVNAGSQQSCEQFLKTSRFGAIANFAFSADTDESKLGEIADAAKMPAATVKLIVDEIRKKTILVEAIPGEQIRIVDENILAKLVDQTAVYGRMAKSYEIKVPNADPTKPARLGFVPTTVGIFTSRNEGHTPSRILSGLSIDRGFMAMRPEQVWTPHFHEKTGKKIEANAEAAAEAAASAGVDAGLDVADGLDDDELLAALESDASPAPTM